MADAERLLVDSSVWIEFWRAQADSERFPELRKWIRANRVVTNSIVRLELLIGAATEQEYARIETHFASLTEIELTDSVWQSAARLGFRLRRVGITVPHADLVIAAGAIENGCALYHCDAHFDLIAQHSSLKVQPA